MSSNTGSGIPANKIPHGWTLTKLGKVCDVVRGGSPRPMGDPRYFIGSIPFLKIADVTAAPGKVVFESKTKVNEEGAKRSRLLPKGTLILTNSGTVCVPKFLGMDACIHDGFVAFQNLPKELNSNYLYHYFNFIRPFVIEKHKQGVTQVNLNIGIVQSFDLLIPPLDEQKQIADKLDVLLARVDACRERLTRVPQILQCLRQSVLTAATSGEFTEDWRYEHQESLDIPTVVAQINERRKSLVSTLSMKKGSKGIPKLKSSLISVQHNSDVVLPPSWFWTSLESLAAIEPYSMTSGPFGSALGTKDYRFNGVPVIRAQNIQEGRFQSDNFVFISSEKAEELNRSKAKPGDLVVVAVGSSGRAALVPDTLKLAVLSQNCNKISIDREIMLPEFLCMYLQVQSAKIQLQEKTTDTVRQFLSLTNLKKTLIPVPPKDEQIEIIGRISNLFAFIDKVNMGSVISTELIERLSSSLLTKAFTDGLR